MAWPRSCYSPCRNPPPDGEDELARSLPGAPTEGSHTPTHSPAVSWTPTPALPSTNELFKQFMKAYLESNQRSSQPLKERKRPLKAKVPDIYYGKLHMDCYQSASNVKIILRPFGPPKLTEPSLQLPFFVETSAYNGCSSSVVEVSK